MSTKAPPTQVVSNAKSEDSYHFQRNFKTQSFLTNNPWTSTHQAGWCQELNQQEKSSLYKDLCLALGRFVYIHGASGT